MLFKKFADVERLGKKDVEGILLGVVHIFPKLDGANGSIWMGHDNILKCGSRNRELNQFSDNFDFYNGYLNSQKNRYEFLTKYPYWILFGEYLKPHTIKNYKDDMWDKFWIFDVFDTHENKYLSFKDYENVLKIYEMDYLTPDVIIENPSIEQLEQCLEKNNFGMKDGFKGEGIVLKNYNFINAFGHYIYGKLVHQQFKEENNKVFGPSLIKGHNRDEIEFTEKYITKERINKLLAKLKGLGMEVHKNTLIPRFLTTLYYEIIQEEIYDFTKKERRIIDFKLLNKLVINKAKELTPELFNI